MFPLSCFRLELSKSNSSTRVPSTTTTRVSSAWAASINIFLDIKIISAARAELGVQAQPAFCGKGARAAQEDAESGASGGDRKSTRLNSSHQIISYAVFCLKKKKKRVRNIPASHYRHI